MIPKHCILFQGSRSRSVKFCFYCHPRPPRWLSGKEPACQCKNEGSILGLGRSPGEGNGNPLQCSCLENPMDRGAWRPTVHGVTKSQAWLNDWVCTSARAHTHTHTHTHTHKRIRDKEAGIWTNRKSWWGVKRREKKGKKDFAAFQRKFLFAVTISIAATFPLCCDYL